jgi:hypothetical protein
MNAMKSVFFCILLLSFASQGLAEKSTLNLIVKDSEVEMKAENIPLVDILKAISDRTGVSMRMDESMREPISIEFRVPVEECFDRLLKNYNYVMSYSQGKDGRQRLSEIYVNSSGVKDKFGVKSELTENSKTRNGQDWFKREIGEGEVLSQLISATPATDSPVRPGIEITMVHGNSPFQEIGLRKGDIIFDVNSIKVTTVEEFIQALKSASNELSNIRIDRRRGDGTTAPIYIDVK